MRLSLTIFLLYICTLVAAAPVTAQQAVMRGVVQDATGAAIPGVLVVVERGLVTHEAVTNDQGLFSLPRVPAGAVRVSAVLSGFQPFRQEIVLEENDEREITIRLEPARITRR